MQFLLLQNLTSASAEGVVDGIKQAVAPVLMIPQHMLA